MQIPRFVYGLIALAIIGAVVDNVYGPHIISGGQSDDLGASLFKDQDNLTFDKDGRLTDGTSTAIKVGSGYKLAKNEQTAGKPSENASGNKPEVNATQAAINAAVAAALAKAGVNTGDDGSKLSGDSDNVFTDLMGRSGISYSSLGDRIDISKDMNGPTFHCDKDNSFVIPTRDEFEAIYNAYWSTDYDVETNVRIVRDNMKKAFAGDKVPTMGNTKNSKEGYGLVKSDDPEVLTLTCVKVTAGDNKEPKFEEASSSDNNKDFYAVNIKPPA